MIDTRSAAPPSPAPAGEGAAALPCLLSDNCDEHRVKLSGVDRKRAERTRQNISHFVEKFGLSTGLLTITFPDHLTTKEAQKRLHNFKRRVLKENFGESLTVREFTQRGRPHFHLVIDCKGDISTGFNWAHHEAVTKWSKEGRKSAKPHGSLNRCPRLVDLHALLNEKGPLYQLGRMELTPVKKPDAVGFYLAGYLSQSLAHKPADAKGTRAVNYSRDCPQILNGKWSWNNEAGWLWRAKLGAFAKKHGCTSLDELKALLGPKWAYHHRQAILETDLHWWPTSAHAIRDGEQASVNNLQARLGRDVLPDEPVPRLGSKRSLKNSLKKLDEDEAREGCKEAVAALQRSLVGPPAPTLEEQAVMRWKSNFSRSWKSRQMEAHGESRAPARCSPRTARAEQPPEVSTASAGSGQAAEECWQAALDGRRLYVLRPRAPHYSPPQKARQLNLPT